MPLCASRMGHGEAVTRGHGEAVTGQGWRTIHSFNMVSIATPRRTQWSDEIDEGSSNIRMKFVEWPVVDSVPARSEVL